MRLMSFSLTTPQILARTKSVTRRLKWHHLKPGDRIAAVKKAMGLKKGEKVERLCVIEIVSVRRERLDDITADDVVKEGFPNMTPDGFVDMFCEHNKCFPGDWITRIEFKYVD